MLGVRRVHWMCVAAPDTPMPVGWALVQQPRREDEDGISHANDWAKGFLRGMELRRAILLDDEKHGGWLVPIFALAHENDPDPEMRP
jgi:yecA family protein